MRREKDRVIGRGGWDKENKQTSESIYQVSEKGEAVRHPGTGVAGKARDGDWDDEHGVYHLIKRKSRLSGLVSSSVLA